jgi:RNA polymerase sigma-70 factor (ECF subfamily)
LQELRAVTDSSVGTTELNLWLERMRAGDQAARDELIRRVYTRMERLARKMLRGFPNVRRYAETGDVLQSALLRLLRALQQIQPESMRQFFGLAATQIRRELLDLARHFYGPEGEGACHESLAERPDGGAALEPPAPAEEPSELDRWCRFHAEVEKLPADEREVVGLVFYHGWSQAQVAELFQVSDRTVRRIWQSALLKLHHLMKEGDS